jgi:chemotaxis protein MotB
VSARRGPNHERWVISYADVLTLLFAFFTMLYAISATDAVKAEHLAQSLRESLGEGLIDLVRTGNEPHVLEGAPPGPPVLDEAAQAAEARSADRERLAALEQQLAEQQRRDHPDRPGIAVRRTEEGLVISLAETAYFAAGGTAPDPAAAQALGHVAQLLQPMANHVRVEGHTDSSSSRDPGRSNWSLSAARAVAVVETLLAGGVPAHRLSAAGFADQRPLMSNETPEGRQLNRRVDIVVLRARTGAGDS